MTQYKCDDCFCTHTAEWGCPLCLQVPSGLNLTTGQVDRLVTGYVLQKENGGWSLKGDWRAFRAKGLVSSRAHGRRLAWTLTQEGMELAARIYASRRATREPRHG